MYECMNNLCRTNVHCLIAVSVYHRWTKFFIQVENKILIHILQKILQSIRAEQFNRKPFHIPNNFCFALCWKFNKWMKNEFGKHFNQVEQ